MKKRQLCILMVAPTIGKQGGGGIATYVESLIIALPKNIIVKRIVTVKEAGLFNKLFTLLFSIIQIILLAIKNKKFTLAHVHTSSYNSFKRKSIIIKLLKFFNIPVILHLHAPDFHEYYNKSSLSKQQKIRNTFMSVDKTIVLSESWKKWYQSHIDVNIPPVVVYNGVDDFLTNNSPISQKKDVVLFLGTLGQRKGSYDLIKAFKLVVDSNKYAKLILAGGGEIEECKSLAKKLNIEGSVIFKGWINYSEKKELLNSSKIFVLPSYNEGFPLSILEAMSVGIPVISTNIGGIPEQIVNNESGYIIEAGDINVLAEKINFLLINENSLIKLGKNSRLEYINRFKLENIVKQIEAIYKMIGYV